MTNSTDNPTPQEPKPPLQAGWTSWLRQNYWAPFVLPFAVFILSGLIEPSLPSEPAVADPPATTAVEPPAGASAQPGTSQPLWSYPLAYTLRIVLTGCAVLLVLPVWKQIPWRCSFLAVAVGLAGGLLWIGICRLKIEDQLLTLVGLESWTTLGDRPHFDPYTALGTMPFAMVAFLAVRLVGLSVIVPLVEELFLRGFLMRFVEKPDWWTIELGAVTWKAALAATLYGVLAHPAEPLAAALWFSLITLLYIRTRSIWDCVVAHGVTNALLGLYILAFRDWTLW